MSFLGIFLLQRIIPSRKHSAESIRNTEHQTVPSGILIHEPILVMISETRHPEDESRLLKIIKKEDYLEIVFSEIYTIRCPVKSRVPVTPAAVITLVPSNWSPVY